MRRKVNITEATSRTAGIQIYYKCNILDTYKHAQ